MSKLTSVRVENGDKLTCDTESAIKELDNGVCVVRDCHEPNISNAGDFTYSSIKLSNGDGVNNRDTVNECSENKNNGRVAGTDVACVDVIHADEDNNRQDAIQNTCDVDSNAVPEDNDSASNTNGNNEAGDTTEYSDHITDNVTNINTSHVKRDATKHCGNITDIAAKVNTTDINMDNHSDCITDNVITINTSPSGVNMDASNISDSNDVSVNCAPNNNDEVMLTCDSDSNSSVTLDGSDSSDVCSVTEVVETCENSSSSSSSSCSSSTSSSCNSVVVGASDSGDSCESGAGNDIEVLPLSNSTSQQQQQRPSVISRPTSATCSVIQLPQSRISLPIATGTTGHNGPAYQLSTAIRATGQNGPPSSALTAGTHLPVTSRSTTGCLQPVTSNRGSKCTVRPMASLLHDIGLMLTSQRVFHDLVHTEKRKLATQSFSVGRTVGEGLTTRQAADTEKQLQLLDRLQTSLAKMTERSAVYGLRYRRCVCGFKSESLNALCNHTTVIDWNNLACCLCRKRFQVRLAYYAKAFRRHMQSAHGLTVSAASLQLTSSLQCRFCALEFRALPLLLKHEQYCIRLFNLARNLAPNASHMDIALSYSTVLNTGRQTGRQTGSQMKMTGRGATQSKHAAVPSAIQLQSGADPRHIVIGDQLFTLVNCATSAGPGYQVIPAGKPASAGVLLNDKAKPVLTVVVPDDNLVVQSCKPVHGISSTTQPASSSNAVDVMKSDVVQCWMCVDTKSMPASELVKHVAVKHRVTVSGMLAMMTCHLCPTLPRHRSVPEFEQHMIMVHPRLFTSLVQLWTQVDNSTNPKWSTRSSRDGTLECPHCSSNFISRAFLCRHHFLFHNQFPLGIAKCPLCSDLVALGTQLMLHLRDEHTKRCTVLLGTRCSWLLHKQPDISDDDTAAADGIVRGNDASDKTCPAARLGSKTKPSIRPRAHLRIKSPAAVMSNDAETVVISDDDDDGESEVCAKYRKIQCTPCEPADSLTSAAQRMIHRKCVARRGRPLVRSSTGRTARCGGQSAARDMRTSVDDVSEFIDTIVSQHRNKAVLPPSESCLLRLPSADCNAAAAASDVLSDEENEILESIVPTLQRPSDWRTAARHTDTLPAVAAAGRSIVDSQPTSCASAAVQQLRDVNRQKENMEHWMADKRLFEDSLEEVLDIDGETVLIVHDNSSDDSDA